MRPDSAHRIYYNEFDPRAAEWLRELMRDGMIPDGLVDERSIADVEPDELSQYTQCHFFAGIGGWSRALQIAGWPENRPIWTGSCPCQPFSCAGKRRGTADERHLWPVFRDLIAVCKPPVAIGEQVASNDGRKWLDGVRADLEALGYAFGAADLCAAGVGAPHIRQRLYWVALSQSARGRQNLGSVPSCAPSSLREPEVAGRTERSARRPCNCDPADRLADPDGRRHRQHDPSKQAGNFTPGCDLRSGGVADAEHPERGSEQQAGGARSGWTGSGRSGEIGGLDDPTGERFAWDRRCESITTGQRRRLQELGGPSAPCGLADAECEREGRIAGSLAGAAPGEEGGESQIGRPSLPSQHEGVSGRLADCQRAGLEGFHRDVPDRDEPGRLSPDQAGPVAPGGGADFWANSGIIFCRDGKYRRVPIESVLQCMADGIPGAVDLGRPESGFPLSKKVEGRTHLLKGIGNAIVPQCAAAFIRAVMKCENF